jgi:diguanylate cyclase (GGDEF)-like protein
MEPERRLVWHGAAEASSAETPAGQSRPRRSEDRSCRILVVDDDVLIRAQLCTILHSADYAVETAASGEDAWQLLRAYRYDVLITDWQMPKMDGMALCRQVRGTPQYAYVYVLMLTVKQSPNELLAGFAAGVDDYVVKGTSDEELLARLERGRAISKWRAGCRSLDVVDGNVPLIDTLTGAYNLAYLLQHLPREWKRAERYGHWLSVLSCELDELGSAGESAGWAAGEELERTFAARTRKSIRDADWLIRTGRNRFAVVLPETDLQGARCVARKLNAAVKIDVTGIAPHGNDDGAARIQALLREAELRVQSDERADQPASGAEATYYLGDLVAADRTASDRNWPAT